MTKEQSTDTSFRNSMFESYPDLLDTTQLCEMLGGISKKLVYKLLKCKKIYSFRAGREYRIPKVSVISYCLGQSEFTGWTSHPQFDMVRDVNGGSFPGKTGV